MKRFYHKVIAEHLKEYRQMVFLSGPRQVGKTTLAFSFEEEVKHYIYFNWDKQNDRNTIIAGADKLAELAGLHEIKRGKVLITFDEIHKYKKWKHFLKGFFDAYGHLCKILVTGSAKLDIYRKGGDSLMGRYFLYRVHPLSVGELLRTTVSEKEIKSPKELSKEMFWQLYEYGGFPEPFLKAQKRFSTNWQRLRLQQLVQEDIRDGSRIQELAQMEILVEVMRSQIGQLTNASNLANIVNVSVPTIQRWLKCLEAFYYCFSIQPWTKNIKRSLRKEPKYYLWDWSLVTDPGQKAENFIASHLLKAVQFWTDYGLGEFALHFIRDKDKQEVDFIVTKNKKPWFIVEVKSTKNSGISKLLYNFQKQTGAEHAFQVVLDMDYVHQDCFTYERPIIVPALTFLSQLI